MTGDLPAAALRLMASCPVRTHERAVPSRKQTERERVNNFRRVRVGATTYESLTEAGRQLGKSRGAVRNMIADGRAHYIK